jgi:putative ABC transport system permease protein
MLGYYLRLALKSFRRTPGLTALMAGAIAFGIAACIVTLTVYHAMSGNPIWWKNGVLYAVTMDARDMGQASDTTLPGGVPDQLTYRDATYLYGSDIPRRKAILAGLTGAIGGAPGQQTPELTLARTTTAGFFHMFDVPFEYGGPWNAAADAGPEPVIVLSRQENEKLYGGADSVGRTLLWDNLRFRVVGVLGPWNPTPRFYDMSFDNFGSPAAVFIPFAWGPTLQRWPSGHMSCWGAAPVSTYSQMLSGDCTWIEMWVELTSTGARGRFQAFVDSYWAQQHAAGRFPRPRDDRLWRVSQWLRAHHAVSTNSRLLLELSFAFLAVCLINTAGILLAKFLRAAPLAGIRRALGASRRQIVEQYLAETALLSLAGSALGLALGAVGLRAIHALYAGTGEAYGQLAHFDPLGIVWALALAALSAFAAGLYPAWRAGLASPARYLKNQ